MKRFKPGDLVRYVGEIFRKELEDVCCVVTERVDQGSTTDSIYGPKPGSYGIQEINNPEGTVFYTTASSLVLWSKIPHWDEEQV